MGGEGRTSGALFSDVDMDARIPAKHPLRAPSEPAKQKVKLDPLDDKNYDVEAFVEGLKARGIEPHAAINGTVSRNGVARKTAVPSEVASSLGYAISQRLRKRIEEGFGWTKTVAGLAQVKVRGLDKVRAAFVFAIAAYDIVRLPKLLAPTGEMGPAA
jgi:Transposase DDE domain